MHTYLKLNIRYLLQVVFQILIFNLIIFLIIFMPFNTAIASAAPTASAAATPASANAGGGSGSTSASTGGSNSTINESAMSISKLNGGQDLNMLSIDSIPSALNGNSAMSGFVTYMFYFLFSIGIILSFFEGYKSELIGGTFSYYELFLRTALIAAGFLSWKQTGMSNFAQLILTLADKTQLYLIKQNVYGIGQSVSQIVSSISGSLHSVSIPTVSSNGTASVNKGWNLNPVSWLAGAVHTITGTVLMGIIWFLFNILYLVIQLFMAFIQLVFLGLLFSICPIILGFEAIPYTKGIFGKWMKMFIEIAFWGVMVALEQLIFFTILGKMESINLPSSETGIGNIIGMFTFAEVVTVFIIMMLINVSVPYIVGKLFEGISGEAHEKVRMVKMKLVGSGAGIGGGAKTEE